MITTPADILGALFDDLNEWTKANKGQCAISAGPDHLFQLLQDPPTGWRLILHWEGDENVNERVRGGNVVTNRFRFIVDGNLGPTAIPNIALVRWTAARTPLLDILSRVRARILSYRFAWLDAQNNRFIYTGSDDKVPLPDGLFLAAYNLSFALNSTIVLPDEEIIVTIPEAV